MDERRHIFKNIWKSSCLLLKDFSPTGLGWLTTFRHVSNSYTVLSDNFGITQSSKWGCWVLVDVGDCVLLSILIWLLISNGRTSSINTLETHVHTTIFQLAAGWLILYNHVFTFLLVHCEDEEQLTAHNTTRCLSTVINSNDWVFWSRQRTQHKDFSSEVWTWHSLRTIKAREEVWSFQCSWAVSALKCGQPKSFT